MSESPGEPNEADVPDPGVTEDASDVELEPTGEPEDPHDATGLDLAAIIAASARGRQAPRRRRPRPGAPDGVQYSSARADARDPQTLGDAFDKLAEQRGWSREVAVRGVFARWDAIVGESVAQHSRPVAYDEGVVTVRCDSTAWATQLRLLASQLVAQLNRELGHGTVTRLLIKGPDAPSWKHGIRSVSDGRGPRDTYG